MWRRADTASLCGWVGTCSSITLSLHSYVALWLRNCVAMWLYSYFIFFCNARQPPPSTLDLSIHIRCTRSYTHLLPNFLHLIPNVRVTSTTRECTTCARDTSTPPIKMLVTKPPEQKPVPLRAALDKNRARHERQQSIEI